MARYKLTLEYEGTRFNGWQKQKEGKTIQGILIDTAREIFKSERVDVQGSGRTDRGVHAIEQIAHLDAETTLKEDVIKLKLNDSLPHDINIMKVEKAPLKFHARHDAVSRTYLYQIAKRRTAFGKEYVWWVKDSLDVMKMKTAAEYFVGFHDFISFTDKVLKHEESRVDLTELRIEETGNLILIRITASHFLWKMVRRIVGTLVETGRGNIKPERIKEFLARHDETLAKFTAPPSGLFLEKVLYKGDKLNPEIKPFLNI